MLLFQFMNTFCVQGMYDINLDVNDNEVMIIISGEMSESQTETWNGKMDNPTQMGVWFIESWNN